MFKVVYDIKEWKGKKTFFHKKYYVFDGLGLVFFDTLSEARSYVSIKSVQLKNVFYETKKIYIRLVNIYLDRMLKFRVYESVSVLVNEYLTEILNTYKYLSSAKFPQYSVSKIKFILNNLFQISDLMNLKLMKASIVTLIDGFTVNYSTYNSTKNPKISNLNNESFNYVEKCII